MDLLCQRRRETISNLAAELGVSERTIRRDIEMLTLRYPIETVCGRYGGGVRMIAADLKMSPDNVRMAIVRAKRKAQKAMEAGVDSQEKT